MGRTPTAAGLTITLEDGDQVEIPSRYEVCGRCNGSGVHDHPAFSNGITSSEWNGPDWDDDSREAYMSGAYDVSCSVCEGLRVVAVADIARCTFAQKRLLVQQRREDRWAAEERYADRMTRFHESGGYA